MMDETDSKELLAKFTIACTCQFLVLGIHSLVAFCVCLGRFKPILTSTIDYFCNCLYLFFDQNPLFMIS